ncbi:MAG: OmpA family protein [Phycisphaerae bacterium]|nr:OmpA family protein [Gemmatimonadaceae bacterium]
MIQNFRRPATAVSLLTILALPACASLSSKQEGAAIGAAAGAAAGGLIGRANGSTARGAIIGAAVGGTVGAVIGHQMDQQAKELKQNIPGATVERVGEGIQVTFSSGLLFDFDSDRVLGESAKNLKSLAKSLDKYAGSDLLIVGHTDSLGTSTYNQDLSLRRARATAAYLTSQGVLLDRIKSDGKGELEPVADNHTEGGQAQNRRVEVAIFANDKGRAAAATKAAKGM